MALSLNLLVSLSHKFLLFNKPRPEKGDEWGERGETPSLFFLSGLKKMSGGGGGWDSNTLGYPSYIPNFSDKPPKKKSSDPKGGGGGCPPKKHHKPPQTMSFAAKGVEFETPPPPPTYTPVNE